MTSKTPVQKLVAGWSIFVPSREQIQELYDLAIKDESRIAELEQVIEDAGDLRDWMETYHPAELSAFDESRAKQKGG